MTGVLGLRVIEADWAEKGEIEELIKERARLREAKKFREADELRKKLLEDRSVELMDHRARTVWVKRERPAAG
jgi:cysteinyl-tRNA synthetase